MKGFQRVMFGHICPAQAEQLGVAEELGMRRGCTCEGVGKQEGRVWSECGVCLLPDHAVVQLYMNRFTSELHAALPNTQGAPSKQLHQLHP